MSESNLSTIISMGPVGLESFYKVGPATFIIYVI